MVNYQDIKTFLLLTLKNWNTDPSLIIDLSRYTNPLVFSRRLKTSIYTSGCKQRAKYIEARNEATTDATLADFVCRQKSQDALPIFHAIMKRANKPPLPKGWCQEMWRDTAGQAETPNTRAGQPELHHNPCATNPQTFQTHVRQLTVDRHKTAGWNSKWSEHTKACLLLTRWQIYKENDFRCFVQELLMRSAEAHSLDFNCRLHPRLLPSWSATFPRGIQTTFLGGRTKIQLSEIESEQKRPLIRKCGPGPVFTECSSYCSPTAQHN